ncbi:hypothetical protein GCM10022223_37470 [Kineosporia mesophila]|uniref:Uncharacterized protein n=1 Tax=Kineosporia mesophila TaxID=566012 RepID=A0ABP6ZQR0_9ACTN
MQWAIGPTGCSGPSDPPDPPDPPDPRDPRDPREPATQTDPLRNVYTWYIRYRMYQVYTLLAHPHQNPPACVDEAGLIGISLPAQVPRSSVEAPPTRTSQGTSRARHEHVPGRRAPGSSTDCFTCPP